MKRSDLQLYLLDVLRESKFSKSAKLQMLNFIKEASEVQLKALILDGEIVYPEKDAEDIINHRFKVIEADARAKEKAKARKEISFIKSDWKDDIKTVKDQCRKKSKTPAQFNSCVAKEKAKVDRYYNNLIKKQKVILMK